MTLELAPRRWQTGLRVAGWALLAIIVLSTLVPIQFRPDTGLPPSAERFIAFAMAGLVMALAYPRHWIRIVLVLLVAAIGLELLQLLVPSRHGRPFDLFVKLFGGASGLALGWLLVRCRPGRSRAR